MRRFLSLFTMLMLCGVLAFAQGRVVSGKVTDPDGNPVPFASVKIKGSKQGVSADANGFYSIKKVNAGDVLQISAQNFKSVDVTVGTQTTVNSSLERSATTQLTEVVVTTGLGIRRKADNLTYAAQGVRGDKLTTTRQTDLNTALAGKIAGLQVLSETEAKLGSSSKIRLRGSILLDDPNRQALILLDGTAIDDISAINMDDVDDVQVLKGPSAVAIYGQRGEVGVLLITTKKARKRPGIGLEINTSAIFTSIASTPRYQNEYSGGTSGTPGSEWRTFTWDPSLPAEWKVLDGQKYHTYFDDASWGPRMNGTQYIPWYAWIPGSEYSFKTAPLVPQPNNVKDFWNKGLTLINNLNFSKAGEGYSARISYTNQDTKGIVPYSFLKKNSISTQLSFDLSSHLTVGANINYVADKVNGEFNDGYGNNSTGSFNSWFHRDLDLSKLRELMDLRTPSGAMPSWNLNDQNGITTDLYSGTLFWPNYYAYFQQATAIKTRNKTFGDINLTYKFNDHFKIAIFARQNRLSQLEEDKLPYIFEKSISDGESALSINEKDPNVTSTTRPIRATYQNNTYTSDEYNYEGLASYNNKFFRDRLAFSLNVGGNIRKESTNELDNGTKGGLVIPDLFALSNSVVTPYYTYSYRTRKNVRSVYASGSLGWNDYLFVDFSGRNDWNSTLPAAKNSYFYPSIGGSFIFSKFTKGIMPFLNYGRIRGSVAQIGQDLTPYQDAVTYKLATTQWNGNSTSTTPDQLKGLLEPSLSTAQEYGIDLRFLKERISFNATYYTEERKKQILPVNIEPASGFTTKLSNSADIKRNGLELTLELVPVKMKNITWSIGANYAKNTSKVVSLVADDPNALFYVGGSDYSSSTGNPSRAPGLWAVPGGEYGQLRGTGILRDAAGIPILTSDGKFQKQNNINFGSILPKFTGGVNTSITLFQNFTISAAADFVKGGKYYSLSQFWGKYSGLLQETATLNDKGHSVRDNVEDGGGVRVDGVDASDKPITRYVDAGAYFHQFGDGNFIDESCFYELTYVKLREVSLSYKLPLTKMGEGFNKIQSAVFGVSLRNPGMIYSKNRNIDPSELVGTYGESGQLPPTRSVVISLKLGF